MTGDVFRWNKIRHSETLIIISIIKGQRKTTFSNCCLKSEGSLKNLFYMYIKRKFESAKCFDLEVKWFKLFWPWMIHNYESLTPCILVAVLYDPASRFDLVLEASPVPVVPVSYILFELFIGGRFPFPFYKLFWNERRQSQKKKEMVEFEEFFENLKFLKNNFLDRRYAMIRIRVIWISTSWNICTWMHFFRFRFRSRG